MLCGFLTNCLESTMRAAYERGYEVHGKQGCPRTAEARPRGRMGLCMLDGALNGGVTSSKEVERSDGRCVVREVMGGGCFAGMYVPVS